MQIGAEVYLWGTRVGTVMMQINGNRDNLDVEDLIACGRNMDISDKRIKETIGNVVGVVRNWVKYAEGAGVSEQVMERVGRFHKYSDE